VISALGTGTNLDIAAADQSRPSATRTVRPIHPMRCIFHPHLGKIGLAYFSPSECEVARTSRGINGSNRAREPNANVAPRSGTAEFLSLSHQLVAGCGRRRVAVVHFSMHSGGYSESQIRSWQRKKSEGRTRAGLTCSLRATWYLSR
jgi:hypothetical protein